MRPTMNGLHILADFHACEGDCRLLLEADRLAGLCRQACADVGQSVVAATGALVLAESHLAIHTWPELDAVTLDLYVCNHSQDNRAAAAAVCGMRRAAFQPRHIVRRDIDRSDPVAEQVGAAETTQG